MNLKILLFYAVWSDGLNIDEYKVLLWCASKDVTINVVLQMCHCMVLYFFFCCSQVKSAWLQGKKISQNHRAAWAGGGLESLLVSAPAMGKDATR